MGNSSQNILKLNTIWHNLIFYAYVAIKEINAKY